MISVYFLDASIHEISEVSQKNMDSSGLELIYTSNWCQIWLIFFIVNFYQECISRDDDNEYIAHLTIPHCYESICERHDDDTLPVRGWDRKKSSVVLSFIPITILF